MAFSYVALNSDGQKVRGRIEAASRHAAYERLQASHLMALELRAGRSGDEASSFVGRLKPRQLADFLHDLGALVAAGVPFRQSLVVMGQDEGSDDAIARVARAVEAEVSSGHGLAEALARALGPAGATLSALIAAGEASGDLGGALTQGAENIAQGLEVSDALVAAISYPLLVLLMTLATLLVILTVVVPALKPLAPQPSEGLSSLSVLFFVSDALAANALPLSLGAVATIMLLVAGWRLGLLRPLVEAWLLDGPLARISRPILFGGAGVMAGALLSARVNASDALRLGLAASPSHLVRRRLERAVEQIREGSPVSEALSSCKGMPKRLQRLATIGEETGQLGPMLRRAGRLERDNALRRLKATSQWLGPALIVGLGGVIGLVFASLLTGITNLGAVGGAP